MTIYNNRTRSLLLLALLAALLGAGLNWAPLKPALAHGDAWTTKAPMLTGRDHFGAAAIGDKLYAVGGRGGGFLSSAEVYDSTTNTWTAIASMQSVRYQGAAAAVGGKLYAMGGASPPRLNSMEVYDPATDAWTYKASMSIARSSHAAAAINGKIYVVGGSGPGILATLEVYDPATDTWETKAPMPTGRTFLAAAALDGKLYVVGGSNGSFVGTLEVYDPATDTWETKAPMPTPRGNLGVAAIDGKLYAIGGYTNQIFPRVATLEVYDPATDTWTTGASMPTRRQALAAAAINGKLYAVGGEDGMVNHLKTLEVYEPFSNAAPVASCQNVTVSAGPDCTAGASIDNGSSDPDGDSITVSQSPPGPYPLGATTVTLTVTDSHGASSSCTATVTVTNPAPTLGSYPNTTVAPGASATITPASPPADNGSISSVTVTAPGFTGGATVNPTTGVVSINNANPAGGFLVTVKATDNCGAMATRTFTLTVTADTCGITVNPATLPQPYVAQLYARTLSATPTGNYAFSVSAGQLPPGLRLVTALGVTSIAGLPTTPGAYNFTIKARRNGTTCEATRNYTVTIPATVVPILECVRRNANNTWTARFGYLNQTSSAVTIPVGANNYFTPGNQNRGQTTVFQPGRATNAFSVTFTAGKGNNLAIWFLRGPDGVLRTVNALTTSIGCP